MPRGFLIDTASVLLANGKRLQTYYDFDPVVEGVTCGTFVTYRGLAGTDHVNAHRPAVLNKAERKSFARLVLNLRADVATAALADAVERALKESGP